MWPGRPVADVIESGRMEMRAKVDENDRANLTEGQAAAVEVDALPGEKFPAKVGALSGLASRAGFFESAGVDPPVRRDLPVRQAGPADEGRILGERDDRGQGDAGCADGAAPGGVPEERQDPRLRQDRRPLRAARGQDRPADREPRRARRPRRRAPRSRWSIRPWPVRGGPASRLADSPRPEASR